MEGTTKDEIENGEDESSLLSQSKRKDQENKAIKSPPSKKSRFKEEFLQENQEGENKEDCKLSGLSESSDNNSRFSGDSKTFDEKKSSENTQQQETDENTSVEKTGQDESKATKEEKVEANISGDQVKDNREIDERLFSKDQPKQEEENEDILLTDKKQDELVDSSLLENTDFEDSFCLGLSLEESLYEKTNDEIDDPECSDSHERKKQKKRKRNKKDKKEDVDEGSSKKRLRPNYFVAVQVSNSDIHRGLVKVQEGIIEIEPKLSRALVDVATSHITLMIARLETEEALNVALSALEECKEKFTQYITDPIELKFTGVDHFRNQVVYAKLVEDEHYQQLVNLALEVRQIFADKGVCMPNEKEFNPHLTIAKMSKTTHRKGKNFPRKIDPKCYKVHKDMHFGSQFVQGLQLLSMNDPKDEKRYYHCTKEIYFDVKQRECEDHSECCFPRRPLQKLQNNKEKQSQTGSSQFITPLTAIMTCAAAAVLLVVISRLRNRQ